MSGAKNDSARASAAMRGPSRQITSALVAGAIRARRDRAGQIGDDQPLGAVGDVGKRQRPVGRKQLGRRFGRHFRHRLSACPEMEIADAPEHRRVVLGRHVGDAGHPGQQIGLDRIEQMLVLIELGVVEARRYARRRSGP